MDTIAINTDDSTKEEGQEKSKYKFSDTAKAAMATGAAGIAAGVAAKTVFDAHTEDKTKEPLTEAGTQTQIEENKIIPESEVADEPIVVVNPDEVMLEEPVAELSTETEMIVESQPQSGQGIEQEYEPFANNDKIIDEGVSEVSPEEEYLAQNTEDVIIVEEDGIDIIYNQDLYLSNTGDDIIVDYFPEDSLLADSPSPEEDNDIQSDLMA
ncbi:MAG: hypothetical protein K2N35_09705 [Muribaculaceae bacterium]|nr:hypothetical protein [Muribaculaceae bacterium]